MSDLARRKLLGVLSGGWLGQCCYALAKLGLPDLLADGPRPVRELAAECGADTEALHRMLRALSSVGLVKLTAPGTYGLTAVSELLRSDVPGSLRQTAVLHGEEIYRAFAEIMHTLHTGSPAFEKVHGQPFYGYLGEHPAVADRFAEAMGSERVPAGLAGVDLTGVRTLVDVGGGRGGLLISALTEHPGLRGVLLELPESLGSAEQALAEAGLGARVELVAGSFFDQVPSGGDVYVLSRVLHNWTDERAEAILRRVRAAMAPGGRLLVLEEFLPAEDPAARSASAGLVDLLMLVMLEGHDRTEVQYRALVQTAGFEVDWSGSVGGTAGRLEASLRR